MLEFYKNKKVLLTGHTGFKGTWLAKVLLLAGAEVVGYSLEAPTNPNLFSMAGFEEYGDRFKSVIGDIRDYDHLKKVFDEFQPEIVLHLAAQPIVRDSYKDPKYTYETNVMGTVNILECVRLTESVKSFLNVTTDKVYHNNEWSWGYRENEPLDGFDPYSNSKSCSELATHSYKNSFFADFDGKEGRRYLAVSTARAGNVIGGGDFANDRIVPDSVRAVEKAFVAKENEASIVVRNPYSTRPYQHVLEPLAMYLTIAEKQYIDWNIQGYYNVGPDDCDCVTTGGLVTLFCDEWNKMDNALGIQAKWINKAEANAPHEANFLKLDTSLVKSVFGWTPRWHIQECMEKTVQFTRVYLSAPEQIAGEMEAEIAEFFKG